jgi:hypothetical protein
VKNENNNLHLKRKTAINCNESQIDMKKEPKLEPKVEPEIEPDDESDDDEDEESEAESAFDPRRSPRIRQNSVRTDSGRSTPIKEQKVPKIKKVRKRKKSNNGEVKSESKSNELISPTLIPKRESLRRVLELSKRTFEDQNNEKDTGDTTGSQSDTSDAESVLTEFCRIRGDLLGSKALSASLSSSSSSSLSSSGSISGSTFGSSFGSFFISIWLSLQLIAVFRFKCRLLFSFFT